MDDGGIVLLKSKGPARDLKPAKWLDPNRRASVSKVPARKRRGPQMLSHLGQTLLSPTLWTRSSLGGSSTTSRTPSRLRIFLHCAGRSFYAYHPTQQWLEQGFKFDGMLRKAAEDILGRR